MGQAFWGQLQQAFPGPPLVPGGMHREGHWAKGPWPSLRGKDIPRKVQTLGRDPSQSSTSIFQFEWAKGMPTLGRGRDRAGHSDCLHLGSLAQSWAPRLVGDHPSHPSMMRTPRIYGGPTLCPGTWTWWVLTGHLKVATIIPVSRQMWRLRNHRASVTCLRSQNW